MATALFEYPKQAYFGKTIPKSKFYEYGTVSNKLKDLFVRQVDQIQWLYKLAPETINLPSTNEIPEIQIFGISIKGEELSDDVLLCIDKAVQYPVVFEITSSLGVKTICAIKTRLITSNSESWKISYYMKSEIYSHETKRVALNIGLNLNSIYEQIIKSLCSTKFRLNEDLEHFVGRNEEIRQKKLLINNLKKKIDTEKQFNKKVELNSMLRIMVTELNKLLD